MSPDFKGRVTLEATVSASEDAGKVLEAMKNLVGETASAVEEKKLVTRLTYRSILSLNRMREQLRDRHVRGAARKLMLSGRSGDSTTLMLNRQAAAVGVVALCGSPQESPLGPIYVTIESEELESVIDWLTAYEGG